MKPVTMREFVEAFGDGCNAKATINRLTAELVAERETVKELRKHIEWLGSYDNV